MAQPLIFFPGSLKPHDIALVGTVLTFLLFLISLPSWIKYRWHKIDPWHELGLVQSGFRLLVKDLFKGFFYSLFMLFVLVICFFIGGWFEWVGAFSLTKLLNAIFLGIGVGFAEELVFRGWLWGEMSHLFGCRKSVFIQAVIFSLAHIRFKLDILELITLLVGLFLLGLLLAIRRILDNGSLAGAIGLHGGLVGTWFFLNADLINISNNAPVWITGPGGANPNPIGGLVAILLLSLLLFFHRIAFAMARFPLSGARNASSSEAIP